VGTIESAPDTADSDEEEAIAFLPRHADRHRANRGTELVRQDHNNRSARDASGPAKAAGDSFQQGQAGCFSDL
jgi:hypothetical protein